MFKFFRFLLAILRCESGDVDPNATAGAGQGAEGTVADDGQAGGDPGEGQGDANAGAGDGKAAAAAPTYGEFGNDATKLFEAFQQLKGKTTATERNSANLRRQLQSLGVMVNEDGSLAMAENAGQRKTRFNDDHKKLFDSPVLQAIEALIEDKLDGGFENYNKQSSMRREFSGMKNRANAKMVRLFPSVLAYDDDGEKNADFNEALYNRATEIWESNSSYKKNPSGELFATMEAALELGVSPIAIQKAKKEGYQKGVEGKKILGPAGGGQKKQGTPGVFRKLSAAEFRNLPADKKEEYQQQWANQQSQT